MKKNRALFRGLFSSAFSRSFFMASVRGLFASCWGQVRGLQGWTRFFLSLSRVLFAPAFLGASARTLKPKRNRARKKNARMGLGAGGVLGCSHEPFFLFIVRLRSRAGVVRVCPALGCCVAPCAPSGLRGAGWGLTPPYNRGGGGSPHEAPSEAPSD